jgi:hypothetical protein
MFSHSSGRELDQPNVVLAHRETPAEFPVGTDLDRFVEHRRIRNGRPQFLDVVASEVSWGTEVAPR